MKTLIKSLLVFVFYLFSTSSFCQNPYNTSNFNEKRATYVSPPIDEISKSMEKLNAATNKNRDDYNQFIEKVIKEMGDDESTFQYKSKKYAIMKFFDKLDKYIENGDWAYMGNDLGKAKSEYYKDILNYQPSTLNQTNINTNNTNNINKVVRIKKEWNSIALLREEPKDSAPEITLLNRDWLLTIIEGVNNNYYKVKFTYYDTEFMGYVHKDYLEF